MGLVTDFLASHITSVVPTVIKDKITEVIGKEAVKAVVVKAFEYAEALAKTTGTTWDDLTAKIIKEGIILNWDEVYGEIASTLGFTAVAQGEGEEPGFIHSSALVDLPDSQ